MRVVLLAWLLAGCVSSNVVQCEDGTTCPAEYSCVTFPETSYCASPDQLAACEGLAEAATCTAGSITGVCHSQACVPSECGNALVDPTEMCDDGNTESFDGCSADCQSTETCRNGVVDAAFGEECDDGNGDNHDGCSATCIDEVASWTVRLIEDRPRYRRDIPLAFDSKRNRVVMFGGVLGGIFETFYDDTFEWDGVRWRLMNPPVRPQARSEHQMAYDALHGSTVLFSGTNGIADTWLWDGVQWTLTSPTTSPPSRAGGGMVYDSKRDRIVMFGGRSSSGNFLADTWTWDGTTWTQLMPPASPPGRYEAQMAYDAKRDRIVLYGGAVNLVDMWEFDGTTWAPVSFSGGPGVLRGSGASFDPVSGHVIFVVTGPFNVPATVWDWDGAIWTKRATDFPAEAADRQITTDTTRGRVVVFNPEGYPDYFIYELAGTVWQKPAAGAGTEDTQYARWLGAHVFDPLQQRTISFGGTLPGSPNPPRDDTAIYDGAWVSRVLTGSPSGRYGAGAAFDVARKQMVLFGGCTGNSYLADTYTFDTQWHSNFPSVPPAMRCAPAMAYDAAHQQVVMFGGISTSTTTGDFVLADTQIWDGANWTLQTPPTSPPGVFGATMAYDEATQKIIMFGGHPEAPGISDETWIWDGATKNWSKATTPIAPPRRYLSGMAWDYARKRLVMVGGLDDLATPPRSLADVWEWDGAAWHQVPTQPGPPVDGHGMVPGLDGGVVVLTGRNANSGLNSDALLRHEGLSQYETCTSADIDGDGAIGCADADCAAVCVPCGNGTCDATIETCASCPADCGACP